VTLIADCAPWNLSISFWVISWLLPGWFDQNVISDAGLMLA
jgi:hypothetical protein